MALTTTRSHPAGFAAAFTDATETPEEMILEVVGELPQELRGTLYRNGPARWDPAGFSAQHVFDGDGLLAKFTIDAGQVRFRSRYVRTPKFRALEHGSGKNPRRWWMQPGGLIPGVGLPSDNANTHAVAHAGRLLALSDIGRPWEIDPRNLHTLRSCNFDGQLSRWSRFSPHPKLDPVTGELFNFGMDLTPRAGLPFGLRCYRVDPHGRLTTMATVPMQHLIVVHDFAITETHLVFALSPLTVDPVRAAAALAGRAGQAGRKLLTGDPARIGRFLGDRECVDVTHPDPALARTVAALPGVTDVQQRGAGTWRAHTADREATRRVLEWLLDQDVLTARRGQPTLEEVYLRTVGDRGMRV